MKYILNLIVEILPLLLVAGIMVLVACGSPRRKYRPIRTNNDRK